MTVDDEIEILEDMVDELPTYFPKHENSGNYKLLRPIAKQFSKTEEFIDELEKNTKPTEADSVESLHKLAKLVNVSPNENEDIEHYRARVLAAYHNVTNEGSIGEVTNTIAYILDVDNETVMYYGSEEPGIIEMGIPIKGINNVPLDEAEILDIVEDNLPAGYSVESIALGTFSHMAVGDESVEGRGYAGLDEDGEPTDTGGTYTAFIVVE